MPVNGHATRSIIRPPVIEIRCTVGEEARDGGKVAVNGNSMWRRLSDGDYWASGMVYGCANTARNM